MDDLKGVFYRTLVPLFLIISFIIAVAGSQIWNVHIAAGFTRLSMSFGIVDGTAVEYHYVCFLNVD